MNSNHQVVNSYSMTDDENNIEPYEQEIIDNLFEKLFEGCENKESKIQKLENIINNNFVNEVKSIEEDLHHREEKWIKDRLKKEILIIGTD